MLHRLKCVYKSIEVLNSVTVPYSNDLDAHEAHWPMHAVSSLSFNMDMYVTIAYSTTTIPCRRLYCKCSVPYIKHFHHIAIAIVKNIYSRNLLLSRKVYL